MRKTFGTVEVLTGNQLPDSASFNGQLFLESPSGNYYKALSAGRNVEWARVNLTTVGDTNAVTVSEDPDHVGFD